MNCLCCGANAGYNRAIVDLREDVVIAGFCAGCETTVFGDRLSAMTVPDPPEVCWFCDDPPVVALPEWYAVHATHEDTTTVSNEYDVDDGTVRLCDHHLETLRRLPDTGTASPGDLSDELDDEHRG